MSCASLVRSGTRAGVVTEQAQNLQVPHAAGARLSADTPGEVRPRAPLFFLSYAHTARRPARAGPNQWIVKFFDDLSENVAELVARPAGADPGFMDRSIPGGTRWTEELLAAVGSCQVFVALLSGPYLASEWCGREWYAFSQRKVNSRAVNGVATQTGIIPVIWTTPAPADQLPGVVSNVQRFSPSSLPDAETAERYETDGVYGLMRLRQDLHYEVVVWRLAQHIAEFHFAHVVESQVLRKDDLRDIFREDSR
jgi:TIR domain